MKDTLQVLNALEEAGVYAKYAIGGAMAATFYVEPVLTYDLDIFILLPQTGGILSLSPLYAKLRAMGFEEQGECVDIHGVPVQFLPAYNPLLEEALGEAAQIRYEDVPTRVLRVEHLAAICVQTGRAKDRDRGRLFREQASIDEPLLLSILTRHHLLDAWKTWIQ